MEKIFDEENKIIGKISADLEENINMIDTLFNKCQDIVKKKFILQRNNNLEIYIVYVDGLTNNDMIENTIIKPLLWQWKNTEFKNPWEDIRDMQVETVDISENNELNDVIDHVLIGDTAVFVNGYEKAFVVSSKKLPIRSISESESEAVMRGPKDSFNESLRTTTALIRRRIKDTKLKVEQNKLGQRSKCSYAIMYMEDLVQDNLVEEVKDKINKYEIDAIYDSGMIEHLMENKWYSPFPQYQSTERPDKAASGILEGRVVIAVDNSPEVLIIPATFNTFFQASDDYYNRWSVATFARILRYVAAFIAIGLPGYYVAITSYHSMVVPTNLLLAMAEARSNIPFPIVVEVLIMELEFELLREAGIRLPGQMGNTIGVVGGLIVGQAAVDAGIVSTIVVIVVALTAIASFAIPNEEFTSAFRLLKFFLLFTSAFFGLYGFILGILVVYIHLSGLKSFGIPYMMPAVSGDVTNYNDYKDFIFRLPFKTMIKRPIFTKRGERKRIYKKRGK